MLKKLIREVHSYEYRIVDAAELGAGRQIGAISPRSGRPRLEFPVGCNGVVARGAIPDMP